MYSADAGDEAESPPATGNKQHKAGKRRNGKEKSFWKVAESCRERLCRAMHFETMLDFCKEDNVIAPDEWLKWSEQEEEGESNGARNLKLLNALALRGRHGLEKLITFLEWEDSEKCNQLAHELQTQTGKTHRRLTPLLWIPSPRSEANPMQSHSGYHNDSLQIECNRAAWSQLYLAFKPADTAEENSSNGTEYGDNDEADDEDENHTAGKRTPSAEARSEMRQRKSGNGGKQDTHSWLSAGTRDPATAAAASAAAVAAATVATAVTSVPAFRNALQSVPAPKSQARKGPAAGKSTSSTMANSTGSPSRQPQSVAAAAAVAGAAATPASKAAAAAPQAKGHSKTDVSASARAVPLQETREAVRTSLNNFCHTVDTFATAFSGKDKEDQSERDDAEKAEQRDAAAARTADYATILDDIFPNGAGKHSGKPGNGGQNTTSDSQGSPEYKGPFDQLLSRAAGNAMSWRTDIKSFAVIGNNHLLETFLAKHELVDESCLRRMKQTTCSCVFTIVDGKEKFVIFLLRLNQSDNALLQLHLLYQVYQGTQAALVLQEKSEFPQHWLPTHLVPGIVKPLMSRSALVLTRQDGWQADRSQDSRPQWAMWAFGLLKTTFKESFCFYKLHTTPPTLNVHVAVNDPDDDFCRNTKCAIGKKAGEPLETLLRQEFLPEPYPERRDAGADVHNQHPSTEHSQPPQMRIKKGYVDQEMSTSSVFTLNPFAMFLTDGNTQEVFLNEWLINLIGGVPITLMKTSTDKLRATDDDTTLGAGDVSRRMERLQEPDSKQQETQPTQPYPLSTDGSSSSSSSRDLQRSTSNMSLDSQDGQEAAASSLLTPTGRQNSRRGSTSSKGPTTPTGYGRSLSLSGDIAAESATGQKRTARARLGPTLRECIVQKIIEKPEEESREDRRPVIYPTARSQQHPFPSSHRFAAWYGHINKSNPLSNLLLSWRKTARVVCCMADEETDAYRVLNRTFGTFISPSILHSRPGNPAARLIVCTKAMPNCLYVILCFHGVDIKQLYNEWLPEYEPLLLAAVGLSNLLILLGREMDKMLGSFASLLHSASRELCDDRGALRRDKLEEPLFNGKLLLVNTAEGEASRTTKSRTYAPRVSDKLSMSKTTSVEAVLRSLFRDVDHFVPRTHPGGNQKIQQFNIVAEEIANNLRRSDIGFYSSGCHFLELHQVFMSAIATGDYKSVHVTEVLKTQVTEMREQVKTAITESSDLEPANQLHITVEENDIALEVGTIPDIPLGTVENKKYSEEQRQLVLGVARAVVKTHGHPQRCNMPKNRLKRDVVSVMRQMLNAKCMTVRSAVAHCLNECHQPERLEQVCRDMLDEFVSSWRLCRGDCHCSHPCLMPAGHKGKHDCLFGEDYEDDSNGDADGQSDDSAYDEPGKCQKDCEECQHCNWRYWE